MPLGDRPRQPQPQHGAAAAARAINRTPLTPKIAAKALNGTPLARRPISTTLTLANSPFAREDASPSTPDNAVLVNSSITPRSGPRQIRVDSANSTPSGTPAVERNGDLWENSSSISTNRAGLGISSSLSHDAPRQTGSQRGSPGESNDSSKFFYASTARPVQQAASQQQQRPLSASQKPVTTAFFYANGAMADDGRNRSPPSSSPASPLMGLGQEPAVSKFFFANGTPDVSVRPSLVSPPSTSGSVVSSNPRIASFRPIPSALNTGSGSPAPRSISPAKSASISGPGGPATHAPTSRTTASSPKSPTWASLASTPPVLQSRPPSAAQRRVSIDAAPKEMGPHRRSRSNATNPDPIVIPKLAASPRLTETALSSPPLSPGLTQGAMTMASILQAVEDLREEGGDDEYRAGEDAPPEMHSPAKSPVLNDSANELVASARRERKVQDLEITNASLAAINRTLERQLRKQTAELRRYRRLSRAGALSAASSRATSLALSDPLTDMSDVDETDETEVEDDGEEADSSFDDLDVSSNDSLDTEDITSPGAKLEVRRRRDEKRLQLDLSKHQELLIDSQKMNQSLKRCLNFTEVLIKEGQKALEYKVRVSDVQLGGRVLAPPDEEDEDDSRLESPWPKSSQDRDSGIELPAEGS